MTPPAVTVRVTLVECVRVPEVPEIVTVEVPVVAVELTVKVRMLVVVVLTGLNATVTPAGRPAADKATLPVKPLTGFTVMVLLPVPPCATVTLAGEADSEKSGAAGEFTVSEMVVVCVSAPEVPVIVMVAVPVVAVLLAVSCRLLVLVVLAGVNTAVTPAGRPEADKATLPVKPLMGFTVMVLVPLEP